MSYTYGNTSNSSHIAAITGGCIGGVIGIICVFFIIRAINRSQSAYQQRNRLADEERRIASKIRHRLEERDRPPASTPRTGGRSLGVDLAWEEVTPFGAPGTGPIRQNVSNGASTGATVRLPPASAYGPTVTIESLERTAGTPGSAHDREEAELRRAIAMSSADAAASAEAARGNETVRAEEMTLAGDWGASHHVSMEPPPPAYSIGGRET